jgi:hypothetical protein
MALLARPFIPDPRIVTEYHGVRSRETELPDKTTDVLQRE